MLKNGGQEIKINAKITTASGGVPNQHACSRHFGENRGVFSRLPQHSLPASHDQQLGDHS